MMREIRAAASVFPLALLCLLVSLAAATNVTATPRDDLRSRGLAFEPAVFLERAGAGDVEAVKLFLAAGMDPNTKTERGVPAMNLAAREGHAEVIRALAAAGGDLNARDNTNSRPLHVAALWGHAAAVKALLELGAHTDVRDGLSNTPLMAARANGQAETAALLEAAGAK